MRDVLRVLDVDSFCVSRLCDVIGSYLDTIDTIRKELSSVTQDEPRKRGRGTMKDAVIGAVSRAGHVVAQLIPDISGKTIADFLRDNVDTENSTLYTDQLKGYNTIGKEMKHETLNRSKKWEKGGMHTNTIEGFWSFIKRAWYGTHHHYTTGYTPCISQRRAISIIIEKLIYLQSFSGSV